MVMNFNVTTVFTPTQRYEMKKKFQEEKRLENQLERTKRSALYPMRPKYPHKSVFVVRRSTRVVPSPSPPNSPTTPQASTSSTRFAVEDEVTLPLK